MANTNCLDGLSCPRCGQDEKLNITTETTWRVTDDGTEHVVGDIAWDDDSLCYCPASGCGFCGQVSEFRTVTSMCCSQCGADVFVTNEGTTHHWGESIDSVDHDADADHTAVVDETD